MTSPGPELTRDSRSELGIDLLRGTAAFMVFLGHGFENALKATLVPEHGEPSLVVRLLMASLGSGGFWVWGFFIISGLCIHQSIARSHERGTFTWRSYTLARMTRIYPMYLIGLAFAVFAWGAISLRRGAPLDFPQVEFIGNWLMVQLFTDPFPFFGPSWTLTCEMAYYFAWPAMLVAFRWAVGPALAVLTALALALAYVLFLYLPSHPGPMVFGWASLNAYAVIWLAGVGLAVTWDSFARWVTPLWWALGWLLLMVGWAAVSAGNFWGLPPASHAWLSYVSIPGWLIVVAGCRHFGIRPGTRAARAAVWTGCLSYPCYILHRPLLAVCSAMLPTAMFAGSWAGAGTRLVLAMTPGLLFIALFGVPWEKKIMRWRRKALETASPATVRHA